MMDSSVQSIRKGAHRKRKGPLMERSQNSLYRLAVFALAAMALVVGCAAETSPDPTPGGEANLNPQPLPPGPPTDDRTGTVDNSKNPETSGSSGASSSGSSGATSSGSSGNTSSGGSSSSSSGSFDAGGQ